MRLEKRIAIVTGCNGEFGSAIVPGFAAEGCDVACVDFKQTDADVAADKVRQRGRRALALAVDLRKRSEVEEMVGRRCIGASTSWSTPPWLPTTRSF